MELRPDKCGVMFEPLPGVLTILALVDENGGRTDVSIRQVIEKLVSKGRPVILRKGENNAFFLPPGFTLDRVMLDVRQVMSGRYECSNIRY